jgi:hypothetical protein
MKRAVLPVLPILASLALLFTVAAAAPPDVGVGQGGGTPGTARNLVLIGHNPLFNRGMNAAMAIFDHYAYVGNRTDGSTSCGDLNATGPVAPVLPPTSPDGTCPHVHPGVLVVDIAHPWAPNVVGEFGTEFTTGANEGQTSRELRVWPADNGGK